MILVVLSLILSAITSCDNAVEEPPETSGETSSAEIDATYYPTEDFSDELQYCADIRLGTELYKIYKYTEDGYRIIGLCSYDISKDTADKELNIGVQKEIGYRGEPYYSFDTAIGISPSWEAIDAVRSYIGDASNTTQPISVAPGNTSYSISKNEPNGVYNIGVIYSYERYYVEVYNDSELAYYTCGVAIPIGDPFFALLYRQSPQANFSMY